jgi:hypothetical protein
MHDPASNNTRFTVPTGGDGLYLLTTVIAFSTTAITTRTLIWFRKNGTTRLTPYIGTNASAGGSVWQHGSTITNLVAGDYIEVMAWQDSGGALNIGVPAADNGNVFSIVKLW